MFKMLLLFLDGASYKLFEFEDTQYSADKVRHAKLEFLPQFKNPCWVERYTGTSNFSACPPSQFQVIIM